MKNSKIIIPILIICIIAIVAMVSDKIEVVDSTVPQVNISPLYVISTTTIEYDSASAQRDLIIYKGISYTPALGAPTDETLLVEGMNGPEKITKFLKVKISSTTKEYYIYQNNGPSGDPHFEFFTKNATSGEPMYMGSTPTGLKILGNGFLYTQSRNNELFETSRKYTLDLKGNIVEVKQPFLHVGLLSRTQKNLTLYANDMHTVISTIASGTPAMIVLYEEGLDNWIQGRFLIATQNDITGWVSANQPGFIDQCQWNDNGQYFSSQVSSPLEGICFAGD